MDSSLDYIKHEVITLKGHPLYNESWVRDKIKDDPSILGLGELEIKDVERRQPKAGRLDLLLRDPETERRYEVELMLGATDASHIIRTIEYWDIERKRYPQYEHCAVIVAEDVTSRFLNVIGLFNSSIPIIAIQMNALKVNSNLVLHFTKVLDEIERGDDDEYGDGPDPLTDRPYWEERSSKASVAVADECLSILNSSHPGFSLEYKKNYIGLKKDGENKGFIRLKPKKQFMKVEAMVKDRQTWINRLEESGLVILPGGPKRKRIHFRLKKQDTQEYQQLLKDFFEKSYLEDQEE